MLPPDVHGRRFVSRTVQWRACRWPSCPPTGSPITLPRRGTRNVSERADVFSLASPLDWRERGGEVRPSPRGDARELPRCTTPCTSTRSADGRPRGDLDPDTFTSPESYDVARLAAGAAIVGVDRRVAGEAGPRWCSSGRPGITPSATAPWASACSTTSRSRRRRARAGGARARRDRRLRRPPRQRHAGHLLRRPDVLYVSSHQFPFYPGTGAAEEIGRRRRRAASRSTCRLPPGATTTTTRASYREIVVPGDRRVRARAPARVGRLRRARARSAGRHAPHRRRLRAMLAAPAETRPTRPAAARSRHRRRLRPDGAGRAAASGGAGQLVGAAGRARRHGRRARAIASRARGAAPYLASR